LGPPPQDPGYGGDGGAGVSNNITGTSVFYGGGGGGHGKIGYPDGVGGVGGGGGSSAGTVNTGGGGAGGYTSGGYDGGRGVVILRYPDSLTIQIGFGLTGTESSASGGYKRATLTSGSGTVTWK
jgi:hypothetical protein